MLSIQTAGAPVILLDAPGPKEKPADPGSWIWTDLFTRNRKQASAFYGNVVVFRTERIEVGKTHAYELFKRGDRPIAGLVELQWEGLEDNWLPYFKVANVDKTIEQVRKLGGHLVLKNGDIAILLDPYGAAFGIQM